MAYGAGGHNYTLDDLVASLKYLPMTRELRQEWQYCNPMYMVLSRVVEVVSGLSMGTFLKDNIWHKLAMNRTWFSLGDVRKAGEGGSLAKGYEWIEENGDDGVKAKGEGRWKEVEYMDAPVISGAGNTISSVLDYAKWLRAFIEQDGPMSKWGFSELRRPRALVTLPGEGWPWDGHSAYSMGWIISVYKGWEVLYHGGGTDGFGTHVLYVPRKR